MLFKTITEIKNHVPVNASFAFARISAFLSEVEQQIIIPLISQAQYDDINTAYNGAGCSTDQQLLLDKIQPPLANLAFALAAPSLIISVGEFGIHITSTEDKKTPFEWQLREWQSRLENAGNSALDTLLTFLETNKTTYTIWAGSTAYPEFKEFFINTTTQFDDVVNIRGSRRLFIALKQAMKRVEDFKILPVIGQEYFDELKTQNAANTTTAANLLALALIRKATAHFTIAFSIPELPLIIEHDAITMKSYMSDVYKKFRADTEFISALILQREQTGDTYLQQLRDLLYATTANYTTFRDSTSYDPPSTTSHTSFPNDEEKKYFMS